MKANTCLGTEQQQQLDPAVSNVFRLVITNICPSNFIHTKYWNCHCFFHVLNILWLVFLFLPTWWTRAIGSEAFQWIRERSTKDGLMRNWWGEVGEPFAEVYQTAKYPSAKSIKDLIHYLCNRVWMIAGRCVCHHYHLLGLTFLSFLRSHLQDMGGLQIWSGMMQGWLKSGSERNACHFFGSQGGIHFFATKSAVFQRFATIGVVLHNCNKNATLNKNTCFTESQKQRQREREREREIQPESQRER